MIMMAEETGTQTGGLQLMLAELESNQLEIQLVPCRRPVNEGGCIRVAVRRNAEWYRKFCAAHSSNRILTRMAEGLPTRSKYAAELARIAKKFS